MVLYMVYTSFNMILQGGISKYTQYFIKINWYFGYNFHEPSLTEILVIFIKHRLQLSILA